MTVIDITPQVLRLVACGGICLKRGDATPCEHREGIEMGSVLGNLPASSILLKAEVLRMRITCSGIQVSPVLHLRVQLGLELVSLCPFVNIK